MQKLLKFFKEEDGSNAIEYGLIASLIGLTIVLTCTSVGTALNAMFTEAAVQIGP